MGKSKFNQNWEIIFLIEEIEISRNVLEHED